MMKKQSVEGSKQFAMLTIDDLVPEDHLVRKIDAAIQFNFIYPIVESTYSTFDSRRISSSNRFVFLDLRGINERSSQNVLFEQVDSLQKNLRTFKWMTVS